MNQVSFAFAGDVVIKRDEPASIFRHVRALTRAMDFTYCNLEGQMCDGVNKNPAKSGSGVHLRSSTNAVEALLDAKVNVVSLANNHTMDFSADGLRQSMDILDGAGIARCGAGADRAEAHRAAIVEKNGLRIAVLSYTSVFVPSYVATDESAGVAAVKINSHYIPNPRTFTNPGSPMYCKTSGEEGDVAALVEDIRRAKEQADIVLVAWHWGVSERLGIIAEYQRTLAHAAIDAGAHAIIGNHAHMVLGVEFYRGRPIFHALGNFAFDKKHPYFREESAIVHCKLTKEGLQDIRLVPLMIDEHYDPVPVRTDEPAGQKIAWMLEYLSEGLNTRFTPRGDHIALAQASETGAVKFDAQDAASLARLGYSAAQIAELKAAGAVA
jgi:poly-gamma-glutamate capsule biosynthesis protein CapA/YwtB (metallophosphatase superfamily)